MVIHETAESVITEPVTIVKIDPAWTGANGNAIAFLRHSGQAFDADALPIYRQSVKCLAERYRDARVSVHLEIATAAVSRRQYVRDVTRAVVDPKTLCVPRCRWQWATGTIMKCQRCGRMKRADR